MPQDISGYVQKFQDQVNKLSGILPHNWKGNWPPEVHHFDAGSIKVSTQVDAASQKAYFAFDYTDNNVPHRVECDLKVAADLSGVSWDVLYDGADMGEAHVAFVPKVGLEGFSVYERIAVEISAANLPGAEHQIRFDGDLA